MLTNFQLHILYTWVVEYILCAYPYYILLRVSENETKIFHEFENHLFLAFYLGKKPQQNK